MKRSNGRSTAKVTLPQRQLPRAVIVDSSADSATSTMPSGMGRRAGHAGSDLASHAGAAEAAIAVRILRQILLVVILGEVEGRRVADLGRDRTKAFGRQRLGVARTRGLGGGPLRRGGTGYGVGGF